MARHDWLQRRCSIKIWEAARQTTGLASSFQPASVDEPFRSRSTLLSLSFFRRQSADAIDRTLLTGRHRLGLADADGRSMSTTLQASGSIAKIGVLATIE